jgi:TusA-related sulfurtransferase
MKTLDCRDMACPKPVNLVQKTLEAYPNYQALHVIVNSEMSSENILTYAQNRGYFVRTEYQSNSIICITITKDFLCDIDANKVQEQTITNSAIILSCDGIGQGIHAKKLMHEFLEILPSQTQLPAKLILINQGVKLACQNSTSKETQLLEKISSCGIRIYAIISSLKELELQEKCKYAKKMTIYEFQETLLSHHVSTI